MALEAGARGERRAGHKTQKKPPPPANPPPPLPLPNVRSRCWELSSATVIVIIINVDIPTSCREMHSAVAGNNGAHHQWGGGDSGCRDVEGNVWVWWGGWGRLAAAGERGRGGGGGKGGWLSPSDDLQGPPFQQSSASAIEYMDSYKENKKCKEGTKIQSCTVIA